MKWIFAVLVLTLIFSTGTALARTPADVAFAQSAFKQSFSGIAYDVSYYPYEGDKCGIQNAAFHGYERCIKSRGLPGIGLPDNNFYWGECKLEFLTDDTNNPYEWDAQLEQKIGCQGDLYGPYTTYEQCAKDAVVCFCQYNEDCMEPYVLYNGEYDYTIVDGTKKPALFVIGLRRNQNIPQGLVKTFQTEFYRIKEDGQAELLITEDCSIDTNECGLSYSLSNFASSDTFLYKIYLKLIDDTGPVFISEKFSLNSLIGGSAITPQDSNNICAAHAGKKTTTSAAIYSSNSDFTAKGNIIGTLLPGYIVPITVKTANIENDYSYCYVPEGWSFGGNKFLGLVAYSEISESVTPRGGISLCSEGEVLVSAMNGVSSGKYYTKIDSTKLCAHSDTALGGTNEQNPSVKCIEAGKTWCSKNINNGYCGGSDTDCVQGYSSSPRVFLDHSQIGWDGNSLVFIPTFVSTNNIAAVVLKLDGRQFGDICTGAPNNIKECSFSKEFPGEFTGRSFSFEISVFSKNNAILRVA